MAEQGQSVPTTHVDPGQVAHGYGVMVIDIPVMLDPEGQGKLREVRVRLAINPGKLARRLGCRAIQSVMAGRKPGYRIEGGAIECSVLEDK